MTPTLFLGYLVCFALTLVAIGFCLLVPLAAFAVIVHVIASVKAYQGTQCQYPFALRLIKD